MRLILLVFVALLGSGCVALTPVAGAPTTAPDTPQSLPSQSVRTVAFAGNGDTMLAAVEALQEAGANVVGVAVIVDRGAGDAVRAAGLEYRAALSLADLGLS